MVEEVEEDFLSDDLVEDLNAVSVSGPGDMAVVRGTPITPDQALRLRLLVFGEREGVIGSFGEEWTQQGFCFRKQCKITETDSLLRCGLVQFQGGSCGVLASVQAYLLKNLLFGEEGIEHTAEKAKELLSNETAIKQALIQALTDTLWQAGSSMECIVVLPESNDAIFARGKKYRCDGITECISIYTFRQKDEVKQFLTNHIAPFCQPRGHGVVLFLYSILLSRGIDRVRQDMDLEGNTLIGSHGYCTQDMVNLALTGVACSNVFDGEKDFDGMLLKGIKQRSQIGFLSLFEHYDHMLVGENYKNPRVPIWVVCSESHYTTLFCLHKSDRATVTLDFGNFDMFYYDELANQTEEIRLTIEYTAAAEQRYKDDDDKGEEKLESPLVHCIRTRWPGCVVNWNGVEPIL